MAFPLFFVEWEDSAQPTANWQWVDEYILEDAICCTSVGYLVSETPSAIALAANLGDTARTQASGILRIPRSAIRRMRPVKASRPCAAQCVA